MLKIAFFFEPMQPQKRKQIYWNLYFNFQQLILQKLDLRV